MGLAGVLVDLSGTLFVGDRPCAGAVAALARLRQALPVRFVTNTSAQSRASLLSQLQSMGFEVQAQEVGASGGTVGRQGGSGS